MTNEQEPNEEVGGEEAVVDPYEGVDEISRALYERTGTTLEEPEPTEEEGGVTEEVTDVTEEVTEEPEALFVLDDGTAIKDVNEAKSGYLRHADYTKKTQELAEERKKVDKYNSLLNYLESNPQTVDRLVDEMRGNGKPQSQAEAQGLQVPEQYKGDQFVEQTVSVLNDMRKELAEVKGGYNSIQKATTEGQQKAETDHKFNTRFMEGYKHLEGRIGTLPTPKEFEERIIAYVKEQEDPQGVAANIISTDPLYIRAIVDRAYEADISSTQSDKVNSSEEDRKKRVAKGPSLRAAGKSTKALPQSLPKDPVAALRVIMDEQEKANR